MNEAQAAALRILENIPAAAVRTHFRPDPPPPNYSRLNNAREVIVRGRRYESVTAAAKQLKCCRETLRTMIRRGEARYAKDR